MRPSHLPLRLATGAYFLNAGLSKRGMDEAGAAGLQGMAVGAVPQFGAVSPKTFVAGLSTAEMALGAGLLVPWVSPVLVGAGLTAFGAGFVQLYLKTPGMTQEGTSVRPTPDGMALAKDVWLLGAGLTLLLDGLGTKAHRTAKRTKKKAKKAVSAMTPGS